MRTVFACFDFVSPDLAAEERNYADVHVALARRLPGLKRYITGRMLAPAGKQPPYYRSAILSFDSQEEADAAMRKSEVAKAVAADGRAHMKNLRWLELDSQVIVPLALPAGRQGLLMIAEFDLKIEAAGFKDAETAEQRYLKEHTELARRLPGLRHYFVAKPSPAAAPKADRMRTACLFFDSVDALREAYKSPVGLELTKDEDATIVNGRIYRLDATIQI